MTLNTLFLAYKIHKENQLYHRYIHNEMIESLLKNLPEQFEVLNIGNSVENRTIYAVKIGNGKKRILLWSQMHGNESTTTKAIFDIFNAFQDLNNVSSTILKECTLLFIPILNPDGAYNYTRVNANNIDLNRDAKDLSQPESKILRNQFDAFKPHYCFNLHGQRTIFSAGKTNNVAAVSFLSPAEDKSRSITDTRKNAMEIISVINKELQSVIPNKISRYDDSYNENCVGDTFQSLGSPTILFEAGHYENDYEREYTRELIYQSLLVALNYIASNSVSGNSFKPYLKIPQNEKCFFDIIIRNAKVDGEVEIVDLSFQYQEKLFNNRIHFVPILEKIGKLDTYFGHKEYNANGNHVLGSKLRPLKQGFENVFVLINNEKYSLLLGESSI